MIADRVALSPAHAYVGRMQDDAPSAPLPATPPDPKPVPATPLSKVAPLPKEIGGAKGPEPTRYGDWQHKGRCTDF